MVAAVSTLKLEAVKLFGNAITDVGGYAVRNINGTNKLSDHATGHALDLSVKPRSADGDAIAAWAIQQPGVKYVIWNNMIWSPSKGWGSYAERGPKANQASPTGRHEDHVHISMN